MFKIPESCTIKSSYEMKHGENFLCLLFSCIGMYMYIYILLNVALLIIS